jgi:hypothetical protein
VKEADLPLRANGGEKLRREPSSTIASCLQSLGEAISRDDEGKNLLCKESKSDDIGADSVHSVVSKASFSQAPSAENVTTPLEVELKVNADSNEVTIMPVQKACDSEKQMTSSVSDNDENNNIKSDLDSSITIAVKHIAGLHTLKVGSDETIDSLQNPKTEEVGNSKEHHDENTRPIWKLIFQRLLLNTV